MRRKVLSPLVIDSGFVHGWAHDPLRPTLTLDLYLDNVLAASGQTGQPVADALLEHWPAPAAYSGYGLPLPAQACDGFDHDITIKVRDWHPIKSAPHAHVQWHCGSLFGAVTLAPQGVFEGWVGFRKMPVGGSLPHLLVHPHDMRAPPLAYTLTPGPLHAGCQCSGQFRIRKQDLAHWISPVFSCQGITLRNTAPADAFKPLGLLESVNSDGIQGWALNSANLTDTPDLVLLVDGFPLRGFRPNIRRDNIANHLGLLPQELGIVGFHIALPPELKDGRRHAVSVRCKRDSSDLGDKPLHYQHPAQGWCLEQARQWFVTPLQPAPNDVGHARAKHTPAYESALVNPSATHPCNEPQVSIVILNRNAAACLHALFESWLQFNSVQACEFIVIDHASHDDSLAVLSNWESRLPITTVALDANDSFSASCNRGARMARAPHVLFVNNDIVWQQDILPAMLSTLQDPDVGIVGVKLLKTEFDDLSSHGTPLMRPALAQVQHLGVRYTLAGAQYWPYEASPEQGLPEALFSPQSVPAVTGALMLCRTTEFLNLGGFDERFFYGYEDVEFCLRLRQRNGQRIICRNDLVALHHHGYTRLTGREPSAFDHQQANQRLLAAQTGLWIQRAWWQSLLNADHQLCPEPLTIGLAFEAGHIAQSDPANPVQLQQALALGEQLQALYPKAQLRFLPSTHNWLAVGHLHLLIAISPRYDLRMCQHPRADLRSAAFVSSDHALSIWANNASLPQFDALIATSAGLANQAKGHFKRPPTPSQALQQVPPSVYLSTPAQPLGPLLGADVLRVQIHHSYTPGTYAAADRVSLLLLQALRSAGALVCRTGPTDSLTHPRVVDVVITLYIGITAAPDISHLVDNQERGRTMLPLYQRHEGAINILWLPHPCAEPPLSPKCKPDELWLGPEVHTPASLSGGISARTVRPHTNAFKRLVRQLQQTVETCVGRTFHSS